MKRDLSAIAIAQTETYCTGYASTARSLREFAVSVRSMHPVVGEPVALAAYKRPVLEANQKLVPHLKELRRAADELIASIEGTWKPPVD